MRVAFNLGSAGLAERAAWLPVEKMRCVLEGDRIVAAAAARDFRQWFGGRELGMSGIGSVAAFGSRRGETHPRASVQARSPLIGPPKADLFHLLREAVPRGAARCTTTMFAASSIS
jgi:hypothetical protein